ncbi:MAG: ribosome silencing factor [Elusimicrobiota bacterium]
MKNYLKLAKTLAENLHKRKAKQVKILDLRKISAVADFFIIATGTSDTHLRMLREAVIDELEETGIKVLHTDGGKKNQWQAIDCGGIIVHLFHPDAREFYKLERLWTDAKPVTWKKAVKKKKS